MYAVEFETEIKDRFIEIKDYENFANQTVRVIILPDSSKTKARVQEEIKALEEFARDRANCPKIDPSINLIKLVDEVNS